MNSLVCVGAFDGPLRSAIHNLKYENDTPLAAPLARLVFTALKCHDHWPRWQAVPPALVPVPLHPGRQRARGFNQSELIARALGRLTGWKIETGLVRVRDTRSQVGLDAARRRDNVRDAFEWRGHAASASIVLVDDVCTSGATLCECARVLLHCGAKEVSAATVARATMDRAAALPAAGRR
jgi:ComF family protein